MQTCHMYVSEQHMDQASDNKKDVNKKPYIGTCVSRSWKTTPTPIFFFVTGLAAVR